MKNEGKFRIQNSEFRGERGDGNVGSQMAGRSDGVGNYELGEIQNSELMWEKAKKGEVRSLRTGGRDGVGKGKNCDLVCMFCYKKCKFIVECIPN